MDELYKMIKYWLDFNGYGDERKSFKEEKYVERIKGDAKQVEIRWRAEKEVSDYFTFVIELTYFIIGLKKIKVKQGDREIKMHEADLELRLSSNIILDKKNKWKNPLTKKVYDKLIINKRIEEHKIDLYKKTYGLHDEIKSFLELHTY